MFQLHQVQSCMSSDSSTLRVALPTYTYALADTYELDSAHIDNSYCMSLLRLLQDPCFHLLLNAPLYMLRSIIIPPSMYRPPATPSGRASRWPSSSGASLALRFRDLSTTTSTYHPICSPLRSLGRQPHRRRYDFVYQSLIVSLWSLSWPGPGSMSSSLSAAFMP